MDWKPIETAPMDGTWILVYEPREYAPEIMVAQWGNIEPGYGPDVQAWVTEAYGPNPDNYAAEDATHWMPLPPDPTP